MTDQETRRLDMTPVWIAIDDPYMARIRVTEGLGTAYYDMSPPPMVISAMCHYLETHGRKRFNERERH